MDFNYYAGEGNKEADWAWFLASNGNAMYSVGYMPHKRLIADAIPEEYRKSNEDLRALYTDNELLEVSQVVVGSNRGALQMGIKSPTMEQTQYCFDIIKTFGGNIPDFEVTEKNESENNDKTEKYNCECIKCGYKMQSEKHCKDIKCPECGGEMRREERPGPGTRAISENKINKDSLIISPVDIQNMKELQQIVSIIKSGRIISEKNRNPIKSTIEQLSNVSKSLNELLNLTEPKQEDSGSDKVENSFDVDKFIADTKEILKS